MLFPQGGRQPYKSWMPPKGSLLDADLLIFFDLLATDIYDLGEHHVDLNCLEV